MSVRTVGILVGVVVAAGAAAWWRLGSHVGEGQKPAGQVLVARTGKPSASPAVRQTGKKGIREVRKVPVTSMPARVHPTFALSAAVEQSLTELQKQLLADIRAALRQDDVKKLVKLIRQMQASDEWPDGIPKEIKKSALEALGWYGGAVLPELINFLGDADPEIVADTAKYWEDAIAECDHDVDKMLEDGTLEFGLATNVKNAAKVISNDEVMESVLSEITSGMRRSVAVETIKEVMSSGTEVAKAKLPAVIEELTDDAKITTAEQLDAWLKANPDDSDDAIMYGGEEDAGLGDGD